MSEEVGMRVPVVRVSLTLTLALLTACTPHTDVTPGIAHPAASASDGFRLEESDALHNFNDINVVLPRGWQARVSGACLTPPTVEATESGEGKDPCPPAALRIRPDPSASGYIDSEGVRLDTADGWWRPDTRCPSSDGGGDQPVAGKPVDHDSFTAVSGERVVVGEWALTCPDGAVVHSRIWYVPDADVEFGVGAMSENVPREDYDTVVRSLDLSRYVG